MVAFQVNNMTCSHCESYLARPRSIKMLLWTFASWKIVGVISTAFTAELAKAIQEAGYMPREVKIEPVAVIEPPVSRGGERGCAGPMTEFG